LQPGQEIKLPLRTPSELAKLRDDYVKSTREYKASLERLLVLYQDGEKKAEERLAQNKKRFDEGLLFKTELDRSESAVADAKVKVEGVRQQIARADEQIRETLNEIHQSENSPVRSKQQEDALLGSKPTQLANGTVPIVMKWF